jgi:hypothetical protein
MSRLYRHPKRKGRKTLGTLDPLDVALLGLVPIRWKCLTCFPIKWRQSRLIRAPYIQYVSPFPHFFCNPILFTICTSTFNKLCKKRIECHVEECSVALLYN